MRIVKWLLFFALTMTVSAADRNEVDWVSRTKTCPEMPDKPGPLTFTVTNVNDILYTYSIDARGISRLENIPKVGAGTEPLVSNDKSLKERAQTPCEAALANAVKVWPGIQAAMADPWLTHPAASKATSKAASKDERPTHPAASKGKKRTRPEDSEDNVPLNDSLIAWQEFTSSRADDLKTFLDAVAILRKCASSLESEDAKRRDEIFANWAKFETLRRKAEGKHEAVFTVFVSNKSDWIFTIYQYNQGRVTSTHRWRCGEDDTLTLSLGTLFTSLPNRSYQSRKAPLAPGTTAPAPADGSAAASSQTILVVENNSSVTPLGAALLNFKIPMPASFPYWAGLSLSSGPVIKLGGSSAEVSSLGYFAGVSAHLWRGLFFTPGVHVGQFADFPVGFSPGMQIPNTFGELNPVKRWTAKFAVGLTYKTASFGGGSKGKSTGAEPAAPKKVDNPKDGGDGNEPGKGEEKR